MVGEMVVSEEASITVLPNCVVKLKGIVLWHHSVLVKYFVEKHIAISTVIRKRLKTKAGVMYRKGVCHRGPKLVEVLRRNPSTSWSLSPSIARSASTC